MLCYILGNRSHLWFIQKGHREVDSPAPLGWLVVTCKARTSHVPGGFCVNVTTAYIVNLALDTAEETEVSLGIQNMLPLHRAV